MAYGGAIPVLLLRQVPCPVRAKPFLLGLLAIGLFAVMNAIIKGMSGSFDTLQVAFMRYLSGGLWILIYVTITRPGWPSLATVEASVVRGVLGLTTGLSFFYALRELPLADAITLSFLAPLFVTLFSMLMLRERPGMKGFIALGLGFAGMLVMISGLGGDEEERSLLGICASLVSSIAYGLSMTLLRARAQKDPLDLIVFFQQWVPALFIAPAAGVVWKAPGIDHLGAFAILGILGVSAHLLLARAFSMAEASRLAPIEFSALIYAAVIGKVYFGEVMTADTLVGAALIMLGAFVAMRR